MTQIHRGEVLENAIKKSDYQIKTIADKLGKPRTSVYNYFKNKDLSLDILITIGNIIHHDFAEEIPEMAKLTNIAQEPATSYGKPETDDAWKKKYFELLEKHTATLTELNRAMRAENKNKAK